MVSVRPKHGVRVDSHAIGSSCHSLGRATSTGEVDEEGLEASGVETPGEIEDVGPGETKSAALKLTPGRYI
jgi:hypothetical protein